MEFYNVCHDYSIKFGNFDRVIINLQLLAAFITTPKYSEDVARFSVIFIFAPLPFHDYIKTNLIKQTKLSQVILISN